MGIQTVPADHFAGHANLTLANCKGGEDLASILNMQLGAMFGPGLVLHVDGRYGKDVTVDPGERYPKSEVPWGTGWDKAFKTIGAAITVARGAGTGSDPSLDSNYDQDHNVVIQIAPGNYAENLILVGAGIHLVGLGYPGTDRGVSITPADQSATHPGSMIVQGSGLEIANILLINDFAYPTIWFDKMHSSWVHDVILYGDGTATVGFTTNGMKNSILERNRISMFATAGIELNYKAAAPDYVIGSVIRDNYVGKGAGTGILIDASLVGYDSYVERNRVEGNGLTLGIDNNCAGDIMILDNDVVIAANTVPIETANPRGGMVGNRIVYNDGGKVVNHYAADA